jgi:hypothetical protein
VAVFLTSRRQEDLEVKYDFSVQKADGVCWGRIGNTFKKFSPEQNSWGYGKAFSKAKLVEKQNELLPDNKLTIVCNLVNHASLGIVSWSMTRALFRNLQSPTYSHSIA